VLWAWSKDITLLARSDLDISIFFWEAAGCTLTRGSSIQGQVGTAVLLLNPSVPGSSKFDQLKSGPVTAFLTNYLQHSGFR